MGERTGGWSSGAGGGGVVGGNELRDSERSPREEAGKFGFKPV